MTRTARCPDCGATVNVSSRPYHGSSPAGPALRLAVHRPAGGPTCRGSGRAIDCVHCELEHDFAGEFCRACGLPPFDALPSPAEGAMPEGDGRGGKRERAGKPPRTEEPQRRVSSRISASEEADFDLIAEHVGATRPYDRDAVTVRAAIKIAAEAIRASKST